MAKILVTGASGAFGAGICRALLAGGHSVAACMRAPRGRNAAAARALAGAGAAVVELDASSEASALKGVKKAAAALGGLSGAVCGAGRGAVGPLEAFTRRQWEEVFEANFFSAQRVSSAVLPFLRRAGGGRLVFVSSLAGLTALPYAGPYTAAKRALEALAETYALELEPFGVECCILEPGAFDTGFAASLIRASGPRSRLYPGPGPVRRGLINPDPSAVGRAAASLFAARRGTLPLRLVADSTPVGAPGRAAAAAASRSAAAIRAAWLGKP